MTEDKFSVYYADGARDMVVLRDRANRLMEIWNGKEECDYCFSCINGGNLSDVDIGDPTKTYVTRSIRKKFNGETELYFRENHNDALGNWGFGKPLMDVKQIDLIGDELIFTGTEYQDKGRGAPMTLIYTVKRWAGYGPVAVPVHKMKAKPRIHGKQITLDNWM